MYNQNICIVSLIGKSQLFEKQNKAWKLNSLIRRNYFNTGGHSNEHFSRVISCCKTEAPPSKPDSLAGGEELASRAGSEETDEPVATAKEPENDFVLDTYFDHKENVLYLHFDSIYDSINMMEIIAQNENEDFFEIWEREQIRYVKSVLLLFSVSHILIISSPNCEFDIGYIRFFRIVDTFRNKMLPSTVELLKSLDLALNKDWIYAGRPCSPRVLFTFENCPSHILQVGQENPENKALKRLQHSLEDQIYNSLRKSYVITNISNNSLFAIPANQEFVYIHRLQKNAINTYEFLLSTFVPNSSGPIVEREMLDADLFRKFTFSHVDKALKGGFNDNIGRTNVQPVFQLPTLDVAYKVIAAFVDFLFKDAKSAKMKSYFVQLKSNIDIDAQFSENRCKKCLPLAINAYQDNLPLHYTEDQHKQRLEKAISLYNSQARGPMFNVYLEKLINQCNDIWLNGRQLCEAVSLTGHCCALELHCLPFRDDFNLNTESMDETKRYGLKGELESAKGAKSLLNFSKQSRNAHRYSSRMRIASKAASAASAMPSLPIRYHSSNIVTRAASNCGEYQMDRKVFFVLFLFHTAEVFLLVIVYHQKDPFTLKEANFTFYNEFSNIQMITQKNIVKYEFQVFNRANETESESAREWFKKPEEKINTGDLNESSLLENNELTDLSQSENTQPKRNVQCRFPSPMNEKEPNTNQALNASEQQSTSDETKSIEPSNASDVCDKPKYGTAANNQKYLKWMTNSASPTGLLPQFSSWSLVSIGKYSDYNSPTGLSQPGFLANYNFLIPWDVYVNNESIVNIFTEKQRKAIDGIPVRAFIGMEYECPCGHRFISSGPDRLVKVSSSGNVKDDAYKLMNCEMPLYTACPCRSKESTPYMAQMMRVFIVTPPTHLINKSIDSNPKALSSNRVNERANLSFCLKPRVQPNPLPCPMFWPSDSNEIVLNDNAIYVLRLPYIYVNDEGKPYSRPKDCETLKNCKVLKGMFSALLTFA